MQSIDQYMISGPSGGMGQNIKCTYCGSFFNESGPLGLDRIHYYYYELDEYNYYNIYTPYIINTWFAVSINSTLATPTIFIWCNQQKTQWSTKFGMLHSTNYFMEGIDTDTFFFKDYETSILFKLTF
ncbi:MAG: hypothetical protein HC836_26230 [Richelia sp. RM2_1_2]|nr:hypothetical protein [Richelia sp. RM2_1_2]